MLSKKKKKDTKTKLSLYNDYNNHVKLYVEKNYQKVKICWGYRILHELFFHLEVT